MNDAWSLPLNSHEKILMLALADCANDDGVCWPGYKNLIKKTGMAKATLSKNIKILKGIGLIKVQPHAEFGVGKKVNTYSISLRHELMESSDLELIEKINNLRRSQKTPISSHLELGKVQALNRISSHPEHDPFIEPSLKQPSLERAHTKKTKRFIKPTIQECAAYCMNESEAENFWHFYESKNWMVGKNKMSVWKSALTRWIKNSSKKQSSYEQLEQANNYEYEKIRNIESGQIRNNVHEAMDTFANALPTK